MQPGDSDRSGSAELGRVVFSEDQIRHRVAELAADLSADYIRKTPVIIGILTGTVMFIADLLRMLTIPVEVDFMAISRFGPPQQTHGAVRVLKDLEIPLGGRHAVLVEDLVDTGFTLSHILGTLQARGPASLRVCALLSRPQRRLIEVPLDYVGFDAPDDFLVGYGMHYRQQHRQLPYIATCRVNEAGR
jgi:hypoxanthine phosphoribosyltransferase